MTDIFITIRIPKQQAGRVARMLRTHYTVIHITRRLLVRTKTI